MLKLRIVRFTLLLQDSFCQNIGIVPTVLRKYTVSRKLLLTFFQMSNVRFSAKARELIAGIKYVYFVGAEMDVHADVWRHIDADNVPDVRMLPADFPEGDLSLYN